MATTTETVLIEFTTDVSGLSAAEDRLEAIGTVDKQQAAAFKQTNAELQKRIQLETKATEQATKEQIVYNKLLASVKSLNGEAKQAVQSLLKMSAREVSAGFDQAAVSVEDYVQALKAGDAASENLDQSSEGLRTRLRNLTQSLGELKLAGKDNTEQYKAMVKEAGRVKDAIGDAALEIKNAGSDTRNIDNVIGSVSALAGGYSAVQGAAALFGDESEELQETLLKVNATMAIASGTQQVLNAFQKEGALTKLADSIATGAQTAAQTIYNLVVGTSIGLMKAFRIALAATGVGLFLIAIVALYEAFQTTEENLKKVNDELERNKALLEGDIDLIKQRTDIELARAENLQKAESDLTRIRGRSLLLQRAAIEESSRDIAKQRDQVDQTSESFFLLNKRIDDNNKAISGIDQQVLLERIKLEGQIAEEKRKNAEEEKKLREEAAAKARELRLSELNDQLAGIERRRLAAEQAGEDTLKFDTAIIAKRTQIELLGEKLTENQKKLIREQAAAETIKLIADTAKKGSEVALQALISTNNAQLAQVELSNAERLDLITDNIIIASQLEINAAEGNAAKIKEIEAKRNADIRAARLKSINDTLNDELALREATGGAGNRALQRVVADEKAQLDVRKGAVDELLQFELETNDKKLAALRKQFGAGLISYKEYNLAYEQITDAQLKAVEDAELKKQELTKKTAAIQKQQAIDAINNTVAVAAAIGDVLGSLADLQEERSKQRFDSERQNISDLREAGAITEKQEKERLKRLEMEEKKSRQQQAQRDKAAAVFKGLLAIPQAALQGLAQGGPFLAAAYAGLAVAQLAIIASRPIPKFAKGKKDRYTGFGIGGEAGTEIMESGGKMHILDKPQVVWLNPEDKIYNPRETREMLYERQPAAANGVKIDYKRIGQEVGKNIKEMGLNIDENGFRKWVKDGDTTTTYLNNKRRWQ